MGKPRRGFRDLAKAQHLVRPVGMNDDHGRVGAPRITVDAFMRDVQAFAIARE